MSQKIRQELVAPTLRDGRLLAAKVDPASGTVAADHTAATVQCLKLEVSELVINATSGTPRGFVQIASLGGAGAIFLAAQMNLNVTKDGTGWAAADDCRLALGTGEVTTAPGMNAEATNIHGSVTDTTTTLTPSFDTNVGEFNYHGKAANDDGIYLNANGGVSGVTGTGSITISGTILIWYISVDA